MTVGTKSLLFGCHQFILHPLMVLIGWLWLYGFRSLTPGIVTAIVVHDWGYWGSRDMDGTDGAIHSNLSAEIIYRLTGRDDLLSLVLLHSRFRAREMGLEPSRLCWADKWGTAMTPSWLWALLAWLTGEGAEYMANKRYENHEAGERPTIAGLIRFHRRYRLFMTGAYQAETIPTGGVYE